MDHFLRLAPLTGLIAFLAPALPFFNAWSALPSLTINELRSHPDAHAGQIVELAGKLTECAGWECSICPEEMTSKTADASLCLPLEFKPLLKGTGFGARASEAVFRFASVKLRARFDPSCLRGPCLDRGAVLYDTEVVDTLTRRKSRSGLWLGGQTKLVSLDDAQTKLVIKAAYQAGFPKGASHFEKDEAIAALTRQYDPKVKAFGIQGAPNDAVVCWVPAGMGDDVWPDSVQGALSASSVDDYYQCNAVRKIGEEWIVQVRVQAISPSNL